MKSTPYYRGMSNDSYNHFKKKRRYKRRTPFFLLLLLTFGLVSTGLSDEPVGWMLSGICVLYDGVLLLSYRSGMRQV